MRDLLSILRRCLVHPVGAGSAREGVEVIAGRFAGKARSYREPGMHGAGESSHE